MKNLHFNRLEKKGRHQYIDDFAGLRHFGDFKYTGFIKCKLVLNADYSVVLPDQIYIEIGGEIRWIQPLYFSGNRIAPFEGYGLCDLGVDVSYGTNLRIRFRNDDLVARLNDGSVFYRCTIKGPQYIYRFTTGSAQIIKDKPYLRLYHHTSKKSMESILKSKEFWSSNWNIQGTKKSLNISYLYLTSLPKISCIDDLEQIAMSSQGKIAFRLDSNITNNPDLILDVYRESTENRTQALSYWVESSLLATQPCYRHLSPEGFGYHAIVSPFTHRIGVEYGTRVIIEGDKLVPRNPMVLNYTVVGDAASILGLNAPFDEENTQEVFKVEFFQDNEEIIEFWIGNTNSNQYDSKAIKMVTFE